MACGTPARQAGDHVANKMARIAWAVMTRGQVYRPAGRAVEAIGVILVVVPPPL